jgi:hypothetical protein
LELYKSHTISQTFAFVGTLFDSRSCSRWVADENNERTIDVLLIEPSGDETKLTLAALRKARFGLCTVRVVDARQAARAMFEKAYLLAISFGAIQSKLSNYRNARSSREDVGAAIAADVNT